MVDFLEKLPSLDRMQTDAGTVSSYKYNDHAVSVSITTSTEYRVGR